MGGVCKREQEGKGNRTLSRKRKNRRLAQLRSKKLKDYVKVNNPNVKHGLMDQASTSIDVTNHYSNFLDIPAEAMFSKVSLLDKNEFVNNDFSCSKRILNVEMEIDNITDASHSSSLSETVDKGLADNESTDSIPNISSYGRRIFDVDYLFSQLFSKAKHEPFNCTFSDIMCGLKDTLQTEPEDPSILDTLNINTAATLACISTGIGYSEFEEFAASINMPMMSATTYANCEAHLASFIRDAAWKTMEETGQEEAKLAKDLGEVDKNGTPCITVVTDGAWSKRSYNVNYDSASGVGCIIGYRTGKLLYLGVRNKYCSICSRALGKGIEPVQHVCFRNWEGPSTAMEADIIAEGFKCSEAVHGIKYTRMVGDGDSSVFRKLSEIKPYGNQLVEKVECRNHLLRNFSSKIRDLTKQRRSSSKNHLVAPILRKLLESNAHRLRIAVVQATRHRIAEKTLLDDKITFLQGDLKNIASHVFGEHADCAKIGYFICNPKCEKNWVPEMKDCGLYQDISVCFNRLVQNMSSLILNMDNNLAEHYNSVVCKFVGGKRKNYSLRRGYETRCEAAAISYNTGGNYYREIHRAVTNRTPKKYTKKFISKKIKILENKRIRKNLFGNRRKNKKTPALPDLHYGPDANFVQSDVTLEEYESEMKTFLTNLQKTPQEIVDIQNKTKTQGSCQTWIQERYLRITASNFGNVCKLRKTTSCQNTVKNLLYSNFKGNNNTRWGTQHEPLAIEEFQVQFGMIVEKCGLFIDDKNYFLAASPDGIVKDKSAIVEVKCPAKVFLCIQKKPSNKG